MLADTVPGRGRAASLYRLAAPIPDPWQDVGVPHSAPVALSRRRFVAAAAGVAGLAVTAGCALPAVTDDPDRLIDLLDAAERDAREFAAADASHGEWTGPLRRIAEVRRVHAERLSEIVERPTAEGQPSTSPGAPAVCPPVAEVRARLRGDAAGAAEVAVASKGARAEIAGAVSAACTAAAEVELA